MKDEELKWKEKNRISIGDFSIFTIDNISCVSHQGKEASFYQLKANDWVTVIAVNEERQFLMVRQFRMGSQSLSLEFPAGVVDKGEDPALAAKRELLEETGYTAEKWTLLGKINPNPAFMSNTSWTFLAENLKDTGNLNWDENEIIQSLWLSEEELEKSMGLGELNSAIMVQAWFWFRCRSDSNR